MCPSRGTIEPYHPTFYDGPVLPDNFEATALLASHISIPIATVERLHSIHEFEMLLKRGAVRYVRPDVAGGLTHSKKIAAVAEASYVGVVPHNPLNPSALRLVSSSRPASQTSLFRSCRPASRSAPNAR